MTDGSHMDRIRDGIFRGTVEVNFLGSTWLILQRTCPYINRHISGHLAQLLFDSGSKINVMYKTIFNFIKD